MASLPTHICMHPDPNSGSGMFQAFHPATSFLSPFLEHHSFSLIASYLDLNIIFGPLITFLNKIAASLNNLGDSFSNWIFFLDPRSLWPIGKEILESCRVCSSRAPFFRSARLSTYTAPCGETQTILKWGIWRVDLDLPEDRITFITRDSLSMVSQVHLSNKFCSALPFL